MPSTEEEAELLDGEIAKVLCKMAYQFEKESKAALSDLGSESDSSPLSPSGDPTSLRLP